MANPDKPLGVAFESTVKGKQAQKGLRVQTVTLGEHELALNTTMSLLADQEAIYFDVSKDHSLVGARDEQPLGEFHDTLCSFFAMITRDADAKGLTERDPKGRLLPTGLTPYKMSTLIELSQMEEFVGQVQALVGQLPGAESVEGPEGNDESETAA